MSQRVALAVIHGIGSQGPRYADGFIARIRARFAAEIRGLAAAPGAELAVRPVLLSGILAGEERRLLAALGRDRRLGWKWLREFMAADVGDAIGYQRTAVGSRGGEHDTYSAMHQSLSSQLKTFSQECGADCPLAIAAHSLGTVVISNYIWDLQHPGEPLEARASLSPFTRLETLTHLYTMGSPLALFALRYPGFGAPITFPMQRPSRVSDPEWVNFLDDDDVVAYPLRGLSPAYARAVTRDEVVDAGNWLRRWNPLSHTEYWGSKAVTDAIARRLARDWRALNQIEPSRR